MEIRSAQQIWEAALGELEIQVSKPNYYTWLKKTTGLNYSNGKFTVGVPNAFVAEYLDRNQRSLIEKVLTGIVHDEIEVQFQVNAAHPGQMLVNTRTSKPVSPQQTSFPFFNPKYTFASFVVGSSNQLAFAAAQGIAQNPGQSYNPLFIYGGTGVGKTHLLQAIGSAALANNNKVLYVSAEQYTNELMTAFRDKSTSDFRDKYRSVDMLLVDDVQFFSGKEKTEENFLYTFKELHSTNRQIAVTSDRPPQAIPLLQEQLRSRFECGLVTDVQSPDFETRLGILEAKAKKESVDVAPDVLELIALQVQQNIRALEGALNRVIAYARLVKTRLTPELAVQALKDIASKQLPAAPVTPNLIIEAVVVSFQLTPSDLKSRKRDEATALARQVAMYLIRQETDCSLSKTGQQLGGRNAATVSHAYQKIASNINDSPTLRHKVFEIQQRIHTRAANGDAK